MTRTDRDIQTDVLSELRWDHSIQANEIGVPGGFFDFDRRRSGHSSRAISRTYGVVRATWLAEKSSPPEHPLFPIGKQTQVDVIDSRVHASRLVDRIVINLTVKTAQTKRLPCVTITRLVDHCCLPTLRRTAPLFAD